MQPKPTTEPIRKPRSQKKFELRKHQRIARAMHQKLVWVDGSLWMTSAEVDFYEFFQLLKLRKTWKLCSKPSFSHFVGLEAELTRSSLNRIRKSLDYWQATTKRASAKTGGLSQVKDQLREIALLRQRLKFAVRILEGKDQPESSWLLAPQQESDFQSGLHSLLRSNPTSEFASSLTDLARIVFWAKGNMGLRRFLTAMVRTRAPETQWMEQAKSIGHWCNVLLKRWPQDERWVVAYEFRQNKLLKEFLKEMGGLSLLPKISKAPFPQCIENHRLGLAKLRTDLALNRDVGFPSLLAAWSIATHHGESLPINLVQRLRESSNPTQGVQIVRQYVKASKSKAFPQTVRLIDSREEKVPFGVLHRINDWFEIGNSHDDIAYCLEYLHPLSIDESVDLGRLRKAIERCNEMLGEKEPKTFLEINGYVRCDFQVELVDAVIRWLDKFPALNLNGQTRRTLVAILQSLCSLMRFHAARQAFESRVKEWASKVNAIAECFPNESNYPKQLRIWLRRLGYYQRLTDRQNSLPKSLRKTLMAEEKRRKELQFLQSQIEAGNATAKAQERFAYLTEAEFDTAKQHRKNIRDTQEACVLVGLEALQKMIVDEAAKTWTDSIGQAVHPSWSTTRIAEMGNWVREMSTQQVDFCRNVLKAFAIHGGEYKSHLTFNHDWLNRMHAKGFQIEHWLEAQPRHTEIKGRPVIISLTNDPYEVLMMGNYFGTCLSQGGCNQMSVLSNAADANKQVLYVHDLQGNVLARQLLAINRRDQMLHYCLFVANGSVVGDTSYEEFEKAVDCYCRDLAKRIGVQLGNSGVPASLGNQFWYDDGEVDWKPAPKPAFFPPPAVSQDQANRQVCFALQAGYHWPPVSCTQAGFENLQPRFQIQNLP